MGIDGKEVDAQFQTLSDLIGSAYGVTPVLAVQVRTKAYLGYRDSGLAEDSLA